MPEDQSTQTGQQPTQQTTTTTATTTPTETVPDNKSGQQGRMFTQEEVDRIIVERLRRPDEAVIKGLLQSLGVESVEVLKTTLDAKRQAEEAQKTELQKAQDRLAAAEKKAADAEARAVAVETQRLTDLRDGKIVAALRDARAATPDDLLILLKAKSTEAVAAVMADGTVDEAKLKALVAEAKKSYPAQFTGSGPGVPSNREGRVPGERPQDIKTNVRF